MVGRINAASALHCSLADASIMRQVVLSSTRDRALPDIGHIGQEGIEFAGVDSMHREYPIA